MARIIIVASASWVFTGQDDGIQNGEQRLKNAACIRRWGTENGLGQLALKGPTSQTALDACGDLAIPITHVIARMACPGWK